MEKTYEAFVRSIRSQAALAGIDSIAALHRKTGISVERLRYILEDPGRIKLKELVSLDASIGIDLYALAAVISEGGRHD